MQKLINGLTLYHGSYCEVKNPDLKQCARYKDFGKGFYLTASKKQAESFIRTSVKKAVLSGKVEEGQNYGIVSVFQYKSNDRLNVRIYPEADTAWLHCVVGHRRKNTFSKLVKELSEYDILFGKGFQ